MNPEEKYKELQQLLTPYLRMMGQAADTIINEGVSKYPILVVTQLEVDLGILLVEKTAAELSWMVSASTLEEMVAKKVIQPDRVDNFRQVFREPHDFLCLFVLSDLGAQFVFIPRKD